LVLNPHRIEPTFLKFDYYNHHYSKLDKERKNVKVK